MAKAATSAISGFRFFEERILEAIDHRDGRGPKPKGMSREAVEQSYRDVDTLPSHKTNTGERVWCF